MGYLEPRDLGRFNNVSNCKIPDQQTCLANTNFHHYIFTISQMWLTSHPRSIVVLLDLGTLGTKICIWRSELRKRSTSLWN